MGNLSEEQNELNSLKQALAAVKKARARLDVIEKSQREPIAIIGMSCRFPGAANSPEAFWRLLETGTDAISQVPADRWNSADLYDSDPAMPGKMNSRWGGFIDQIDQFDANFFGISPREATQMDPQQRLVLEIAWEAIENSGLTKDELAGSKTGVYIGVHSHSADYTLRQYSDPSAIDIYTGTGTAHNVIAGRLAYLFDLRGPSMTVDTACSSSLVAVHLACQSLRSNESQMALVAGVNLMLSPEFTIAASKMHMLAPDGRCKAFDAQANGFVRGEGCGVIVLKRLSDALAHGDNIIAMIRGSALNQDGRTNGLTAPNGLSQQQVVRQALENAAVGPSEIGFVEAHGTGTSLGDVIELDALGTIFDRENRNGKPCFLGSAKTNIGHLEGAAGIAGLIKAVLSLQKRMIPPLVHFKNLNPNISLKNTSLVVPSTLQPWQEARKRFAAVSSFGWSGTNAHVVLEEAPPADSKFSSASTNPYLLPLSAHAPEALRDLARSYSSFLTQASPSDLADVCYTASCRRTHHANRLALVGASSDELINKISAFLQENLPVEISRIDDQAKIVFVFPGQGSQWLGMGRELLKQNQVFRETLQRCEQAIQPWVDWSLTEQLGLDEDSPNYRLNEISVIQPILFAFEIALSAVWRSWGIEPHAVIGHSMGEVAAAYIAGALRLEDAAHVICRRSQLMQRTSGRGGMAVVGISIVEANQLIQGLEDRISVAVNNSPRSTVLSGDPQALEEIMEELARRDIFCRRVRVDVASHSPQMDPLRAELVEALRDIKPQAAHIPFFSTVTEEVSHGATLNAEYWGRNLRQPVQFGSMIQKLLDADHSVFIEMSPHPILLTSIQEVSIELNKSSTEVASLRRDQPEMTSLLGELGLLYRLGYPIDWKKLYPTGGRVVSLPAYPWQHESFWLEVEASTNSFARTIAGDKQSQHAVLGQEIELAVQNGQRTWEFELSPRKFPFMYDHKLQGLAILAASNFLEMALAATEVEFGDSPAMLTEIEFQHPLVLPSENRSIPFQFHLVKLEEEDGWAFQVFSRRNQAWTRHIVGRAVPSADTPKEHPIRLEDLRSRCVNQIQREAFYTWLENNHIAIGRNIQNVTKVGYSPGEVLGLLEINEGAEQSTDIHRLRLAVLDGCFQLSAAATPEFAVEMANQATASGNIYVPSRLDQLRVHGEFSSRIWVHAQTREDTQPNSNSLVEDIRLYDETGQLVAEILGLSLQQLESQNTDIPSHDISNWLYRVQWESAARDNTETSGQLSGGLWLIFADQGGVGDRLAQILREGGEQCILVLPGEMWDSTNQERFAIRPGSVEDMQRLLKAIFDSDTPSCRGIVHLWSLDTPAMSELNATSLESALVSNCSSVLHLVQETVKLEWKERPRFWLVTQGGQPVLEAPGVRVSPAQATLWGLGRVIAREHAEFWGGMIDLDPAGVENDQVKLLQMEIKTSDQKGELAFRQGQRYEPRLARLPRPMLNRATHPFRWRADASYLITGALGEVGVQVIHWMVQQGARRLILMGRTPMPPRSTWQDIDPASSIGRKISAIRSLEALGASIHLAAVDVADEGQLIQFVETFERENWPPIRGVIHTAAVIEDRLLLQLDANALRKVLRPKAVGAWLLHRLFKEADCFLMFSSVGSLLGQPGQSNYAAANAFLDVLAFYRRDQSQSALSINWGAWKGLGFAASGGGQQTIAQLERHGMSSFSAEEGLTAMQMLLDLDRNQPQVAVLPANWTTFSKARKTDAQSAWTLLSNLIAENEAEQTSSSAEPGTRQVLFHERLQSTMPEQQGDVLKAYIQDQVARALRMPASKIGADQALGTLGLESLMAIELRNRLESDLSIKLSATLLWNYPTINQLADHLASKLNIRLGSAVSEKKQPIQPDHGSQQAGLTKMLVDVNSLSEEEALKALLEGNGNE